MQLAFQTQAALLGAGYSLLFNALQSDESVIEWVRSRRVDATVLVGRFAFAEDFVRNLVSDGAPCVIIDAPETVPAVWEIPGVRHVLPDFGGSRQAARILLERGHRRIGLLGGGDIAVSARREDVLGTFLNVLESQGVTVRTSDVLYTENKPVETFLPMMRRFLERGSLPTAFLSRDSRLTEAFYTVCTERGHRIPDDFSVIASYGETENRSLLYPPVTALCTNMEASGRSVAGAIGEALGFFIPGETMQASWQNWIEHGTVAIARNAQSL